MSLRCLEGQRVLELGSYIASPYAGHLLSHLGADVVKIEPFSGDPTRALFHGSPGGTFIAFSHGKRSICIDLRSSEGHAVFERLVASAVILVHNLAPETVRKLRLSHEDCHGIHPELIYCHIAGYGPGPLENEKITNPLVEAATGIMAQHKVEGRPTRLGPSYFDLFAGSNAVIGILSALASTRREGRHVEVGLYETGLHVSSKEIIGGQLSARAAQSNRLGSSAHEFALPGYGSYRTRDGRWIHLLMLSDSHWSDFCGALGIVSGPELSTLKGRQAHRAHAEILVTKAIAEHDFDDVAGRLRKTGCSFSEVIASANALDTEQARHHGKTYRVRIEDDQYAMPAFPIRDDLPAVPPRGEVPRLGQHTMELLESLDYAPAEQHSLVSSGAVFAGT